MEVGQCSASSFKCMLKRLCVGRAFGCEAVDHLPRPPLQDGTEEAGNTYSGTTAAGEPRPATAGPLHSGPGSSGPHSASIRPSAATAPAAGPASPPPPHAAFPGLNRFVRPSVMRDGVAPPGHGRGSSSGGGRGGGGGIATNATKPQPFKLSTDKRAAHRRHRVLSACEATRQLVQTGEPVCDVEQDGAAWPSHGQRSGGGSAGAGQPWQPAVACAASKHTDGVYAAVSEEPQQQAAGRQQAWAQAADEDDDVGSAWSEGEQQRQQQQQPHQQQLEEGEGQEQEEEGDEERWGVCSVSSSLQQGSGRWGAEPGEDEAPGDVLHEASSYGVGVGETSHAPQQPASAGEQAEDFIAGSAAGGGHPGPGSSGSSLPLAGHYRADEGVPEEVDEDEDDGCRCHGQPPADPRQAGLPAEQRLQHAAPALGAQPSRRSLHGSSCSTSPTEQRQHPSTGGGHARPAGPPGHITAGACSNSPPAAAARPRSLPHRSATTSSNPAPPARPAAARPPPGTWRPPSPPKDASRPTTAGSARPASASRDHRRGSLGGGSGGGMAGSITTSSRRGTTSAAAMAAATSLLQQAGPTSGAAAGLGPALTAADVERLRAAEARRRRQADDKARALAAELAAHMTALAEAHHRRSLLLWCVWWSLRCLHVVSHHWSCLAPDH